MKKILISVLSIAIVGAVAFGATRAFFSDTETSTGNVLAAGAIDLQIDNTSYVTDVNGVLVASTNTSWTLSDLTVEKFFNFTDLKPGDIGEDTISLHVNNNDAYVCAAARVTEDSDVDYTEPELDDDTTVDENNPLTTDGELAENVNFAFWADDGDNVLETDEVNGIFLQGPISGLGQAGQIALADTTRNIWQATAGPVLGGQTFYIGKAWCFGTLTPDPATEGNENPVDRGDTGFDCSGAGDANNAAQTDRVMGDLQFYAVQSRNNADFTCAQNYTPEWPTEEAARPAIDGVAGAGEWDGCTTITFAGDPSKGTACVIAYTDYMYVLYQIADPTDDRSDNSYPGNDKLGLNINPDSVGLWGKPYDIVFQTGTDPAAFTTPDPDEAGSSGLTDGWESEWVIGNDQQSLPGNVETMTLPYAGSRISEWKLPLSSIAGLSSGSTLKVGGAADIELSSYAYPSTLDWSNPIGTFVDVTVQ